MNISIVLAQVLGIFFVVMGVSMIVNKKFTTIVLEESIQNRGYLWMWGFLALMTGAIIVPLNNLWTSGLPLLVTVLGWLALIKGAFILFFPGAAVAMYRKYNKDGLLVLSGLVVFALGLSMLYAAFM